MRSNIKVLLLLPSVSDYRVFVYNLINQRFDLTVAFNNQDNTMSKCVFKKIKLPARKLGNFFINNFRFYKFCKEYDVIIYAPDIHCPMFCSLPFLKRSYPVIPWSIGTRASYKRKYDINRRKGIRDLVMYLILKKSDAILFYMNQALDYWRHFKLEKDKIFIAHNTVQVIQTTLDKKNKKNLLFVGSLYKEKGVDVLLKHFLHAYLQLKEKTPILDIVGGGGEYELIKKYINENGLSDFVKLHGPIYDEYELSNFFVSAIACISPNQAGLTVLKSMGYGVPFITKKDAITGGEIFNIEDNVTGLLYNEDFELKKIIIDIVENKEKYLSMGTAAKNYYSINTTPEIMADAVIRAIDYVFKR